MFEFYLWLMVDDGPKHHWEYLPISANEDELDAWLEAKPQRLREKIGRACLEAEIPLELFALKDTYGGMIVTAAFSRNHPLISGTERRFLEAIIRQASTSYGVVYTLDTDKADARGEFRVWKLANGQVVESKEMLVPPAPR